MTKPSGELSGEVEGWELSDGKGEQDQIVNGVWYRPMLGCDSLEWAIDQAKREAEIKTAERFLDEPWVMLVPPKDSPDKYVWIRRHQMKDLANQIINQSENK